MIQIIILAIVIIAIAVYSLREKKEDFTPYEVKSNMIGKL